MYILTLKRRLATVLALGALSACGESTSPTATAEDTPAAVPGDLTRAMSTAVHVRVAKVKTSAISQQTTVSGVLSAFRKATIAAEVGGRVMVRHVEPGDTVRAGQAMITLDNERAKIARDEAAARKQTQQVVLAEARNELKRAENLVQKQFISEDTLETLRFAVQRAQTELNAAQAGLASAERAFKDTVIRAPFHGSAEFVHVQQGDFLNPGAQVATLVDFSRVRVHAGVTAREAAMLQDSATAQLGLEALGSRTFTGQVHSIARLADPATGTYNVEIWLDNDTNLLREGMIASVRLPYASEARTLVVPSAAVFRREGTMHVFTVADGRAHLQAVETGRTNGPVVEVVAGLDQGQQVVIEGQFALRDGALVTVDDIAS